MKSTFKDVNSGIVLLQRRSTRVGSIAVEQNINTHIYFIISSLSVSRKWITKLGLSC